MQAGENTIGIRGAEAWPSRTLKVRILANQIAKRKEHELASLYLYVLTGASRAT
jgi:hypothetical protein